MNISRGGRAALNLTLFQSMMLVSSAETELRYGLWFQRLFAAFSSVGGTGLHVYAGFMRRSTDEPLSQPLRIATFEPRQEMAALEKAKARLATLFTNGEALYPQLDALAVLSQAIWERALANPDSSAKGWWENELAPHGQIVRRVSLLPTAVTGFHSARDVDGFHLPIFQLTLKR